MGNSSFPLDVFPGSEQYFQLLVFTVPYKPVFFVRSQSYVSFNSLGSERLFSILPTEETKTKKRSVLKCIGPEFETNPFRVVCRSSFTSDFLVSTKISTCNPLRNWTTVRATSEGQ